MTQGMNQYWDLLDLVVVVDIHFQDQAPQHQ
jgi:hypothetical protein